MKQILTVLCILFTSITVSNAQQIEIEKALWGYNYSLEGKRLSMGNMADMMKLTPSARKIMKSAKLNKTIATVLIGTGGAMIGLPIGQSVTGEDPTWIVAGIGAGLALIAIPISTRAHKKARRAVDLYNSSLNLTHTRTSTPNFNIIANKNGIGLSMTF